MRSTGELGRLRSSLGVAVAVLVCVCSTADAHRMDLTVRVVGGTIEGKAAYHGGRPAAGASVELRLASGEVLATAVAGEDGRFSVPVSGRAALEVFVHTADGHAARTRLAAEALPSGLAEDVAAEAPQIQEELARRVAHLVVGEVSRQLVPISDGLADLERRVAVRDVLGGIGYLLGLAGIAAYLLARRRSNTNGEASW